MWSCHPHPHRRSLATEPGAKAVPRFSTTPHCVSHDGGHWGWLWGQTGGLASSPLLPPSLFCFLKLKIKNGGLKQTPREEQKLGECTQCFSKYFPSLQLLQNQGFSEPVQQNSFSCPSVKTCNLPVSTAPSGKGCHTSAIHQVQKLPLFTCFESGSCV